MTLTEISVLASKWYRIEPQDMFINTRKRENAYSRHLFCYIAHKKFKYTLYEIARFMQQNGKKFDHSSVVHSTKVISELIEVDRHARSELNKILIQLPTVVSDIESVDGLMVFPDYLNIRFKSHIEVTAERIKEMRESVPAFVEAIKKLVPEFYPEAELATFMHSEGTVTKIKKLNR